MSSKIDEKSSALSVYYAKYSVMAARQQQLEALSAWVRQQKEEKNYTYEDIERRSRNYLTKGTANNIVLMRYKEIKSPAIKGLAYAFGVEEDFIYKLIQGESPEAPPKTEEKPVELEVNLWKLLREDAKRCRRSVDEQLSAILSIYYDKDADVNIDIDKLTSMPADARLTPHASEKAAEVPFVKVRG